MSNNLIRKSLAAGAGFALIATGLVAAPAQAAATSLEISPLLGSGTNSVLGATFNLKVKHVGGASGEDLSVFIDGATAANVTAFTDSDGHEASFTAVPSGITDSVVPTAVDNTAKTSILQAAALDLQPGEFTIFSIKLDDANVTATTSITLTPFLDTVLADDKVGSDEVSGAPITVTFHKASEVTATVSKLTLAPIGASATTSALVTLDKNVNMADTVGGVGKVVFTKNGDTEHVQNTVAYSVADEAYKADSTTHTIAKDDVISAVPTVEGEATASAGITAQAVAGGVNAVSGLTEAKQDYWLDSSDAIRAGSGSFTTSVTVTPETKTINSGHTVTWTIAEESATGKLDAGAVVTVDGKTLRNASAGSTIEKISTTSTTNASGVATVTISYTGLKAGNELTVTADTVGQTGVDTATSTFTVEDSIPFYVVPTAHVGGTTMNATAATDPTLAITKGDAISIAYSLRDQFGQVPAGTFRLNASLDGGNGTQTGTFAFSNGEATVSFVDNSSAAGDRTLTLDPEKLNSAGTSYVDISGATEVGAVVNVAASASPAADRVVITRSGSADGVINIEKETFVNTDTRLGNVVDVPTLPATGVQALQATVYNTSGALMPGAVVTFTAPGVQFLKGGVYSVGSATYVANKAGVVNAIQFGSNTTGAIVFTATVGSVSDTETITFDNALEDEASEWVVTAPANVSPGSTFKVTAKLVDKYGNGLDSNDGQTVITYDGPGIIVGGALPDETGADGTLTFSVLLGSNDTEDISITFREFGANDATGSGVDGSNRDLPNSFDDIVATVSILNGAAPAVVGDYGTVSAWTKNMGDGTAKVYVKFPTVGDKVRIGHQTGGSGSYETIYVKTTSSETMSGLTVVEGVGTYIVRTIDLADINRIRVTVGEDVLVQVRYNE